MAYAGIQLMLLSYKMQKADKEYELMNITHDKTVAAKDIGAINDNRQAKLNELNETMSKDDPRYSDLEAQIEDEYEYNMAEIAAWEDEIDQKDSNCQTQIKLLDGYINSWQTALQTNVQKAHTYGSQS